MSRKVVKRKQLVKYINRASREAFLSKDKEGLNTLKYYTGNNLGIMFLNIKLQRILGFYCLQ